jgi:hypothetical protein
MTIVDRKAPVLLGISAKVTKPTGRQQTAKTQFDIQVQNIE